MSIQITGSRTASAFPRASSPSPEQASKTKESGEFMNSSGRYVRNVPSMGMEKPPTTPYVRETPKCVLEKPEPLAPIVDQGTIAGFGRWTLHTDGLLAIDGKGKMPDWEWSPLTNTTTAPWRKYRHWIMQVQIAMGVTSIGHKAFYESTTTAA